MTALDVWERGAYSRAMKKALKQPDEQAEADQQSLILKLLERTTATLEALTKAAIANAGAEAQEQLNGFGQDGNVQGQVLAGTLPTVDPAREVVQESKMGELLRVQDLEARLDDPTWRLTPTMDGNGHISRVVALRSTDNVNLPRNGFAFDCIRHPDGNLRFIDAKPITVNPRNSFDKPTVN